METKYFLLLTLNTPMVSIDQWLVYDSLDEAQQDYEQYTNTLDIYSATITTRIAWSTDYDVNPLNFAKTVDQMSDVATEVRKNTAGTPLWGLPNIKIELCRCVNTEVFDDTVQDCGCAFGQCAKGLIY